MRLTKWRRADEHEILAVRLGEVDHGERQVAWICGKGVRRFTIDLLQCTGFAASRGQLPEQSQLPLADDTLRIVGVGANYAARLALIVRHRAIGEGVVGLFGISAALHYE